MLLGFVCKYVWVVGYTFCSCCTHTPRRCPRLMRERCWAVTSSSTSYVWSRRIQYLKRLQQGKQQCPDRCGQVQTYIFFNLHTTTLLLVYFALSLVVAFTEQFILSWKYYSLFLFFLAIKPFITRSTYFAFSAVVSIVLSTNERWQKSI